MGWFFRVRDAAGNLQLPRALSERKSATTRGRKRAASNDDPSLAA
jgi:hypothetical protein